MIRAVIVALLSLALACGSANAFDASKASRYPSPDLYRPNVDALTINGPGSTGEVSGMSVRSGAPNGQPATLGQIIGSTYSVAQEGGWGKSQADNDRIFGLALAYSLNAGNGPVTIDIPMGTWRLTVPRNISTAKPFKLRGSGRGQTRIIVDTGGPSLLNVQELTVGAQVSVEGIEFQAAAPGIAAPLVISFAGTASGPSPYYQYSSLYFRDLSFVGLGNTANTGVNYFINGFDVTNAWQPIVDAVHFTGAVQNRRGAQNGGIFRYSFAAQVSNFFTQYAVRALYLPGGASNGQNDEGFAWHSGEAVDVDYGIEAIGIDPDPGFIIGPVHINAGKSCIKTVFKSQFDISRVLCYKLPGDTNDFNGIDIQKAAYGYLSSIQIGDARASNTGGALTGVKLTDSYGVAITGLTAQGWRNASGFLLYLSGTTDATRATAVDASLVSGLTAVGFDPSVGNANRLNTVTPAVLQALAVNSSTPSVANDRSGLWTTTNSAPTSITGFPWMVSGQEITIFMQDSVTTYVHSANMRLKGGVNATAPAGSTITFKMMGGTLAETGRSF